MPQNAEALTTDCEPRKVTHELELKTTLDERPVSSPNALMFIPE